MMFADLLLATERLKSEKRFLSNMIIKLVGENQQLLKENKHFRQEMRSLQYPQRYIKRTWEEIEVEDGIKIKKPKAIKHQQEEVYNYFCFKWSRLCDCQLARHQEHLRTSVAHHGMASCDSSLISDSVRRHHLLSNVEAWQPLEHELTRNAKKTLQFWEKKMEEKKVDLFKEQVLMVETRAALIEQGKHIESLQMKINCLQEELKDSELQATLQAEKPSEDHYATPCFYEVGMEHLESQMSGAGKRSCVYVWQTSTQAKRPEDDTEKQEPEKMTQKSESPAPEVPQLSRNNLNKKWLEESIQRLQGKGDPKASKKKVLRWLQASMENLAEKVSEAPKPAIEEWLKESRRNFEETCPEEARQDVKEWLDVSISNLQEEGPETCYVGVQEWHEECIKSIQGLQESEAKPQLLRDNIKKERLEESTMSLQKEASKENVLGWLQEPMENLREGNEASRENMQKWLQASIKDFMERGPEDSSEGLQEWLESSMKKIDELYPGESRQDMKEWFKASIRNFQDLGPEASHIGIKEWLEASMQNIQEIPEAPMKDIQKKSPEANMESIQEKGPEASSKKVPKPFTESHQKSMLNVGKWLQSNLINRIQESSETSIENVQEWIEESLRNVEDELPEPSRQEVTEWLEETRKGLQEGNPEASKQNLNKFLKESILSLKEDIPPPTAKSVHQWLEESIANVQRGASRLGVQKWLEQSLKTMEEEGPDVSGQDLQQWFETAMGNLDETCPEASRHDVKGWLETSMMNLQEQGPEASKLNVHEWLAESVQNFKEGTSVESIVNVEGWAESAIESLKEEASHLNTQEWLAESLAYLKEDPVASQQDIKQWLEESKTNLSELCSEEARMDVDKWLREVTGSFQEEGPEAFKGNLQGFIRSSMSNLKQESIAASRASNRDWAGITRYTPNTKDTVPKIKRNVSRMKSARSNS
ncbi:tiggrin-like [Lacerta agilis]|uniref:tiggrin-like n=1 Tax=Lacerta agilis TaxID=80427 RepID=UPI0014191142|nr:tiggrin-like [Lacerta agilis]